jgi:hypothetical protein
MMAWIQAVFYFANIWTEFPPHSGSCRNLQISLDDGRIYFESVVRPAGASRRETSVWRMRSSRPVSPELVFPWPSVYFERSLGGHLSIPIWHILVFWVLFCGLHFRKIRRDKMPNKTRHDNPYQPPCFDEFP